MKTQKFIEFIKKLRLIIYLICFLFMLIINTQGQNINKESVKYMPPEKIDVWEQTKASKTYFGEELFDYIDGGAVTFINQGFKNIITNKYTDGDKNIQVEIYEMESIEGARNIFDKMKGEGESIKSLGNESIFNEYYLIFYQNNFLVMITLTDTNKKLSINNIGKLAEEINLNLKD